MGSNTATDFTEEILVSNTATILVRLTKGMQFCDGYY